MAVRRPLRRVGTELQACSDDDMIRLRYYLRRAYAKMMEGGDGNNVGLTSGKLGTVNTLGLNTVSIGSTTDNYKTVQYNQGTGQWNPYPTEGGPYGHGPGSDYPGAPGTGTTSTTTTLYQCRDWNSTNSSDHPSEPSASDMEHSYLVYDSSEGIVMETNEQNIYDTILDDCIEEMHGRSSGGSSVGDGCGSYYLTGSSVPNVNYSYWTVYDSTVMIDRVHGDASYGTYKIYMKKEHNYVSSGNDGAGPGTEYHLLKESSGEIVHNPIGIDSDLVNKVLLPYLCRNLDSLYTLTTNANYPGENRGTATDHYYNDSTTSYEGPDIHGSEAYRTYSTPSGTITAYTTYYLKLHQ